MNILSTASRMAMVMGFVVLSCLQSMVNSAAVNAQHMKDIQQHTILAVVEDNALGLKYLDDLDDEDVFQSNMELTNTKQDKSSRSKRNDNKKRRHSTNSSRKLRQLTKNSRSPKKGRKSSPLLSAMGLRRKACQTKTRYVFKTTAEDIFGNIVQVHPVIKVAGLKIDQYFYETYCQKENCNCAGTDHTNFASSCETTYTYTFARVVKNGEIGWTYIKVRSGCSCMVRDNSVSTRNILDLLK